MACNADNVTENPNSDIPMARKIHVLPIDYQLPVIVNLFSDYLQPYFSAFERPVRVGDVFSAEKNGRVIQFQIVASDPSPCCIVGLQTILCTESECVRKFDDSSYNDVVVCRERLQEIMRAVETKLKNPEIIRDKVNEGRKGILIHGPSGTGKTMIANVICKQQGVFVRRITAPEMMQNVKGEPISNLREDFEIAKRNSPSIILMDELDAIASDRSRMNNIEDKNMVTELITLMDELQKDHRVVVIGVTSRVHAIDPDLRKSGRFDLQFELTLPDKDGRLELLRKFTEKTNLATNVRLDELAEKTRGFSGAELNALCSEAGRRLYYEKIRDLDIGDEEDCKRLKKTFFVGMDHFVRALQEVTPYQVPVYDREKPNVRWDEIAGLSSVKRELKELIGDDDKYGALLENRAKGVLLFGPSGSGKTLLARALAGEWKAKLITVNSSELIQRCPERRFEIMTEIFNRAREMDRSVVLIEEVDLIASDDEKNAEVKMVFNHFLAEIDGVQNTNNILVIGTTDRPDILDLSLLRPGRLGELLYVPLPDREARELILLKLLKNKTNESIDVESLASRTHGFSGGDLSKFLQLAARKAFNEDIEMNNLPKTKEADNMDIKPGPESPAKRKRKETQGFAMQHCNDILKYMEPSTPQAIVELYEQLSTSFRQEIGHLEMQHPLGPS